MKPAQSAAALLALTAIATSGPATAQSSNLVAGTWRIVSATAESNGNITYPYGKTPLGKLVFTSDLHFIEFIYDPSIPHVKSNERGKGTDAENRAILAGSFALYGRYTVDESGSFSGNVVEGSSFPNWVGDVRTTKELTMTVEGDRMTENFQRPGGVKITIIWERFQ